MRGVISRRFVRPPRHRERADTPISGRGLVVRTSRDRGAGPLSCSHVTRPSPRLRRALIAPAPPLRRLASEVVVEPDDDPVPRKSAINLDSVESVSVAVLVERLGRLSDNRMREVCAALAVAVDCRD